ncbi:MAG: cell division protease FtsH, partial [Gaiellaceae bacterium]|nr:cell division protease FtsH [Gaiellaceae bacterium]
MNRFFRSALFPLIVIAAVVWLATMTLRGHGQKTTHKTLSEAVTLIRQHPGQISQAVLNPNKQELQLQLTDKSKITVHYPADTVLPALQTDLQKANVKYDSKGVGSSAWWTILSSLLPFVLLFGFWIFLMNQVQGGGSKVMSFGKSRAKRMTPDSPKIGFKDVAG